MKQPTLVLLSLALLSCTSASKDDDSGAGGAGGSDEGGSGGNLQVATGGKGGGNSPSGGSGGTPSSTGGATSPNTGGGAAGSGAGGTPQGGMGGASTSGPFLTPGIDGPKPETSCLEFTAKLWDFQSSHSDFQSMLDNDGSAATPGIVLDTLGPDGLPQLAANVPATAGIASSDSFKQWFKAVQDVNKLVEIKLTGRARPGSTVLTEFGSDILATGDWFPIDGKGFGNTDLVGADVSTDVELNAMDAAHNQLFTARIDAEFYYQGNEIIISESDDDSWIFINGKLAVDNGGLHGFIPASVSLKNRAQDFGLTVGKRYPISFFFAERLFGGARYRVGFNNALLFTHCKK